MSVLKTLGFPLK